MQNVPSDSVDAWISKGKLLDPKRLIPAIVQYDHAKQRTQVSSFLNYLILRMFSFEPCLYVAFVCLRSLHCVDGNENKNTECGTHFLQN